MAIPFTPAPALLHARPPFTPASLLFTGHLRRNHSCIFTPIPPYVHRSLWTEPAWPCKEKACASADCRWEPVKYRGGGGGLPPYPLGEGANRSAFVFSGLQVGEGLRYRSGGLGYLREGWCGGLATDTGGGETVAAKLGAALCCLCLPAASVPPRPARHSGPTSHGYRCSTLPHAISPGPFRRKPLSFPPTLHTPRLVTSTTQRPSALPRAPLSAADLNGRSSNSAACAPTFDQTSSPPPPSITSTHPTAPFPPSSQGPSAADLNTSPFVHAQPSRPSPSVSPPRPFCCRHFPFSPPPPSPSGPLRRRPQRPRLHACRLD
jgi:hypothetical protein